MAYPVDTQGIQIGRSGRTRPVLVGIVGDSAAGKTTLTDGIANVFGRDRVDMICTDDYHRYDRQARKQLDITPLHPECNYMDIMEQHLRLLASGEPILKPIYDHSDGTLTAPVLVEPRPIIVVEGLLGYHTQAMRDCYDVKVYLDPPEDVRRRWKINRDTAKRGYEPSDVIADLERREPDSAAFIRPQKVHSDIVVRFHPPSPSPDWDSTRFNVTLLLRPTLPHPYLIDIANTTRVNHHRPIRLTLGRDSAGRPVDYLEVSGDLSPELAGKAEEIIWKRMGLDRAGLDSDAIGLFQDGEKVRRSQTLAITQLLLVAQISSVWHGFPEDVEEQGQQPVAAASAQRTEA